MGERFANGMIDVVCVQCVRSVELRFVCAATASAMWQVRGGRMGEGWGDGGEEGGESQTWNL